MNKNNNELMNNGNRRKKGSKSKILKRILIGILFIFLIVGGIISFYLYNFFYNDNLVFTKPGTNEQITSTKINIMIIGYDSKVNGKPRSDTLMLASFDLKEKALGIVSIPRDTRVLIPGNELHSKVNSAFAKGGAKLTVATIEQFFGVPIDYYIATDFEGLEAMIDTLGGIEIDVKQDMEYEDIAGGVDIHIPKGRQILNGNQAVDYVRFRDDLTADLGRIERQQEFINEAIRQFLSPETVLKIPDLIGQFKNSISTNMSAQDMINLAKLVKNISRDNIKSATIPGEGAYRGDVSYFIHDPERTENLVHDLIASKEYISNSRYKIAVLNGNGVAGIARDVSKDLKIHGFIVNKVDNAKKYNYENTLVIYTKEITSEIEGLAELLNGQVLPLSESDYAADTSLQDLDILVILGEDFSS